MKLLIVWLKQVYKTTGILYTLTILIYFSLRIAIVQTLDEYYSFNFTECINLCDEKQT
jgi:hypothetical protein